MQQPKNPNSVLEHFISADKGEALQAVLKSLQEDIEDENPHYIAAADKDSFRSGFANGVESASLYGLVVTLNLVTSGQEAGAIFVQLLDMLETMHYAGHVLRGGQPRCAAVEKLMEEAALGATIIEKLSGLMDTLKAAIKEAAPPEPPTTVN